MTKSEIRKELSVRRDRISLEEKAVYDAKIHLSLYDTLAYQQCSALFAYLSFRSEIDTITILLAALKEHKKVYVPRVEGKEMNFYEIHDLNSLIPSSYGILEPAGGDFYRCQEETKSFGPDQKNLPNQLMLLPGLAFDPLGNRIGYGGGYYDRYLSRFPKDYFYRTALAYDLQILDRIESKDYDMTADAIITPTRTMICYHEGLV